MMSKMNDLELKVNGKKSGNNKISTNKNISETTLKNPKTSCTWRRYCQTCGCCDHWGRNYNNPKAGHKVEATFKDRMNGGTKGVLGA